MMADGSYRRRGSCQAAALLPSCDGRPHTITFSYLLCRLRFFSSAPEQLGIGESTWLPIFFPHRGTAPVWRLEAAGGWQGWTRVELMRLLCADVPIPSAPTPHNLGRGGFGRAPDRKMGCIVTSNLPLYLVASRLANLSDNVDGRRGGGLTN